MPSGYQYIVNEETIYTTLQNVTCLESTEYFDSVCGMNAIIPSDNMMCNETNMEETCPYLNIIEQPADTFRYRYKSEKGSHGGIKGEGATRKKKCFPTVKLENCSPSWRKKVVIKVSLYTNESVPKPHFYELAGKNCSNGKCEVILDENFTVVFQSLAILAKKREEVLEIVKQRKISDNEFYDEASIEAEIKNINLDSARLCFEAFSIDNKNTPLCKRVFSKPINNQKSTATGDLKILRLSRCSGKCSGGDEVWLICDKIRRDDIKVRFYEGDWEAFGDFNVTEIYHQGVIIFNTPAFYQRKVRRKVYIQLLRPSDKKYSEPRQFEYIPDDDYGFPHLPNKHLQEFPEISRNHKKRKLNFVGETEDYTANIHSSVMDSPQSTETEDSEADLRSSVMDSPQSSVMENIISKNLGSWLLDGNDSEFDLALNFDLFPDLLAPDHENADFDTSEGISANMEHQSYFPESVAADSINQISLSMDSLSFADCCCKQELKISKMQKSSKDFIDGMKTILQNRVASTYLHYAPHLIPTEDEDGNSMIHLAILEQNGNLNLIKKMSEMVSEDIINNQNKFKETPLHLAVKGDLPKILVLLLAKGGDPNLLDRDGNNCLQLAAKYGHINCLKVLRLFSEKERKLKHKLTMDINALNYDGMSALHLAIIGNFQDCMEFLLTCKADVNLPEKKCGRTSLHLAIEQPSLLQTILKQPEIDIDTKDFRGYTAVQLACMKTGKSFEIVSAQLENDKDKIIKFLENFNQNGGVCDLECSELESDRESTCSSDFEDAVEELSSISCKEVISKTVSVVEQKKSNLMKTEEELYKYLDMNDNWKKLADLIGLDTEHVAMFDEGSSPGLTILRTIKDLYHPCELQTIIEILKLTGLEEGVHILQKNLVSKKH
ncbi:nuclear factor NF-kappa-B p110 subunit-like [Argiope bruennichi]|uniref:nuclear factor NF-kappa-B p110 subunit-like n=1 Tax=Argiope bruennichi TaxID=94029 RepID=UPI0024953FDE|nr:nuclear factor NF-kappa-B p110 subunit-like [Argiope bruennichi]